MAVSEFTREWCKALCVEKAIDLEITRLSDKENILRVRELTPDEAAQDVARRAEAARLFQTASEPAART